MVDMPPQNQQNQNVPNNQGQYDFFMAPGQAARPKLSGPTSMKSRIIIVVSGLVLLVIIASVISAVLNSGPKATDLQTSVAQDQQEIIRLTTAGINTASSAQTKNFAITTQFTITSEQQQLVAYLAQGKVKVGPKQLALKQSSKADQELATALAAGVYDQSFTEVMTADFTTYVNDLNTAFKKTKGPNGRKLIQQDYTSAQVLIKQLKNLPTSASN
jgi:hypothetical protein